MTGPRFPLKVPDRLPDEGLLIGYSLEHEHHPPLPGFNFGPPDVGPRRGYLEPILHTGDGHLMTIAPTGSGKGVGAIIPALLHHHGSVIIVDPKGENYAVTARRRREMGQKVVCLDPFGITDCESPGAFNPLDLIEKGGPQEVDTTAMLAELLVRPSLTSDPFWDNRARQLITGLMLHVAQVRPRALRNLVEVRYLLYQNSDDLKYLVEEMRRSPNADVRLLAGMVDTQAEKLDASIRATAQQAIEFLRGTAVSGAVSDTSFDLSSVTDGDPITIYIVIPPDKLESHAQLLRLWIGGLFSLIMRRRRPLDRRTLFVLDEAAQLGALSQLRQAITLLRGYGLQTWSFWQDINQIRQIYGPDWETMFNNCKVIQSFGFSNLQMAQQIGDRVGFFDSGGLVGLDTDEMLLMIAGDEPVIAQRPNYLTDPCFAGMSDPNPYHSRALEEELRPQRPQRHYTRRSLCRPSEEGRRDKAGHKRS